MSRKRFKFVISRAENNSTEEMFITRDNLFDALVEVEKVLNFQKDKMLGMYQLVSGGKWEKVEKG